MPSGCLPCPFCLCFFCARSDLADTLAACEDLECEHAGRTAELDTRMRGCPALMCCARTRGGWVMTVATGCMRVCNLRHCWLTLLLALPCASPTPHPPAAAGGQALGRGAAGHPAPRCAARPRHPLVCWAGRLYQPAAALLGAGPRRASKVPGGHPRAARAAGGARKGCWRRRSLGAAAVVFLLAARRPASLAGRRMGAGPHTQPLTQPGISCPSSPLCSIPDTDFLRRCVGPFAFFTSFRAYRKPCIPSICPFFIPLHNQQCFT